jgi:hypothetical protein
MIRFLLFLAIFTFFLIQGCSEDEMSHVQSDFVMDAKFDSLYDRWLEEFKEPVELSKISLSSTFYPLASKESFREISSLGRSYLPYLIEKLRIDPKEAWPFRTLAYRWSKKHFLPQPEYLNRIPMPNENIPLYVDWWYFGRDSTFVEFERYYNQFRVEISKHKIGYYDNNGHARLRWLGVDALPLLIKKMEEGDSLVVQIFSEIIYGGSPNHPSTKFHSITEVFEWWAINKNDWLLPKSSSIPKESTPNFQSCANRPYFLDGESPSLPISSFRQANEIKCVQFE